MTNVSLKKINPVSRRPIGSDGQDLQTVCILCSHNCGVRVDVERGAITAVRPDKANQITEGYICNKAVSIPYCVNHKQRIAGPLRRREDGSFGPISWDQALEEIAARLKSILEKHSPSAIGVAGVGGQGNHLDGPFILRLLNALGSKRFFSSWAQEKHQHSLISQWMFDAAPTTFLHPDLDRTSFHMVIGSNPKISNRAHKPNVTYRDLSRTDDVTLVVVDPRTTETSRQANEHVQLLPGTDAWFLLGMLAHILRSTDLMDTEFLLTWGDDLATLQAEFSMVDVEVMARRSGLDVDQVRRVAENYARAESACLLHDLGAEQIPFSTLIAYLLQLLAVVTGNIGQDGGSVFASTMKPAVRGSKRFQEPARALASGIQAIASQGGMGMFSPTLIPEEILCDHPKRLRALIVEGANPWLSYSDTNAWRNAREKLELLVVIDPAMTETALQADYVLPAPSGYEKWEWSDFVKGYPAIKTQVRPPVVPVRGNCLPEPEIHVRLMEKLGLVPTASKELQALANGVLTPSGAQKFLTLAKEQAAGNTAAEMVWAYNLVGPQLPAPGLVAVWLLCFANARTRRGAVLNTLGETWRDANPYELGCELWQRVIENPGGVELARTDRSSNLADNLGWEDRKIRLLPQGIIAELHRAITSEPVLDANYPLVLSSGLRTRFTANTIQRDPAWRKGKGSEYTLHMSIEDLEDLGLESGEEVRVSTDVGSVCLPVQADKNLRPGMVWMPNGYGMWKPDSDPLNSDLDGVNMNEITAVWQRDPISGCPHHKHTLCRVDPVGTKQNPLSE